MPAFIETAIFANRYRTTVVVYICHSPKRTGINATWTCNGNTARSKSERSSLAAALILIPHRRQNWSALGLAATGPDVDATVDAA